MGEAAWHLTSFGSTDELLRKLTSFGAANLFTAQTALDPTRLAACTARCLELLSKGRGGPPACHTLTDAAHITRTTWGGMPRLPGRRISSLAAADLPPKLLRSPATYPAAWTSGMGQSAVSDAGKVTAPKAARHG